MHAQGARDLQMGAGDNGKRLTTCVEVAIPIGMASFCCRCLGEGVHGVRLAGAEHERVVLITSRTRLSICDGDAW